MDHTVRRRGAARERLLPTLLLPALLLLASFPAAACARSRSGETPGPPPVKPVANTYWRLMELNGAPSIPGPPSSREPHLRLLAAEARAVGATGCNTFSGRFTLDGDRIHFSNLASTRMACIDPAMIRQEPDYLRALDAADRLVVAGDMLTLFQDTRAVARFVAMGGR